MNVHNIVAVIEDNHPLPACPDCDSRIWRRETTGTIYEDQILRAYPVRDQYGNQTNDLRVAGDWETIDQETNDVQTWFCDRGHPTDAETEDRLSEIWNDV